MRFADVPGHDDVKQRLRDMADSGRIPHALLLEGPSGIGKFALARAFAQYIHCTDRHDGDSCGVCPSCRQHETFNHVDTVYSYPVLKNVAPSGESEDAFDLWKIFLEGDEKQSADRGKGKYMDLERWLQIIGNPNGQPVIYSQESQRIITRFSVTSYSSRYRVMLMWLPERMNVECANRMLKMIEEPTDDSLLIFVSNTPQAILPTVYSRLQRIKVRRLEPTLISNYLLSHSSLNPQEAEEIASLSDGSILDALHRLTASEQSDQQLEMFMQLMRLAYQRKVGDLRRWADALASAGREGIVRFLDYCVRMLRENFIYNLRVPQLVGLNRNEAQFASRFAPFINERNVMSLLEQFELAKSDIAANTNARMVLFHMAVTVILLIKR